MINTSMTYTHTHVVADNFGIGVYAIFLFFLTILWSLEWGDATACPYTHMEDLLEGKSSIRSVLLKTWAQLIGGCCVYRFVQIFWWFEFAHTHEGRAFAPCTTDLQVSLLSANQTISWVLQPNCWFQFTLFQSNAKNLRNLIFRNNQISTNLTVLGGSLFRCVHRRYGNVTMSLGISNNCRFGNKTCNIHRFICWNKPRCCW